MKSYVYISDIVEIKKSDKTLDVISELIISIADKHDFQSTILEQRFSQMIMFSYNSSRVLSPDEMEYLDLEFNNCIIELRSLLHHQKFIIL
ncbi:MAG: hypothetical protein INQ03_21595 [Candidatus Heimdallarchaeota archaeon]|nr:hypothetical protein [Candidatus Heimdallarchaeota archaeon]